MLYFLYSRKIIWPILVNVDHLRESLMPRDFSKIRQKKKVMAGNPKFLITTFFFFH